MNRDQNTGLIKFFAGELKPKGRILTPFNVNFGNYNCSCDNNPSHSF